MIPAAWLILAYVLGVPTGMAAMWWIDNDRLDDYRAALVRNRQRYEQLRVDTLERLLDSDSTGLDSWK